MWNELFKLHGDDPLKMGQAIYSSLFILQNRMQTAGEKLQTDISMKQWLLLSLAELCPEPRTLTKLGELMGCSRQNVKKLALALEKQGFVKMIHGSNNSVHIEISDKAAVYMQETGQRHAESLQLLFSEFRENEIEQLFDMYTKLYKGMEKVEKYAAELE